MAGFDKNERYITFSRCNTPGSFKQKSLKMFQYREKDIMCMTSTRWLVGIYNDAANKSWSKYTTLTTWWDTQPEG